MHSTGQLELYKDKVDEHSIKVGGSQCIHDTDSYIISLDVINWLPYMKMQPDTKK